MTPSFGAVILTMGTRPDDFPRALETLLRQRDVDLDVVVVGNGVVPSGLPNGVRAVSLPENVGVPQGRNVGAANVKGDLLLFYDDDALLPDDRTLVRLAAEFDRDPRIAVVQPRPVDPSGLPTPRRWVPRLRVGSGQPGGPIVVVWEGVFAMRRAVFDAVGGWPGHFFFAHEGIDLMWRVWDAGYIGWYAPDIEVNHPATSHKRHAVYYRTNARNRVWLALRNLPAPLVPVYLATWTAITIVRERRNPAGLRQWAAGFREGLAGGWGTRRPMSWRTVARISRAGRPPIV